MGQTHTGDGDYVLVGSDDAQTGDMSWPFDRDNNDNFYTFPLSSPGPSQPPDSNASGDFTEFQGSLHVDNYGPADHGIEEDNRAAYELDIATELLAGENGYMTEDACAAKEVQVAEEAHTALVDVTTTEGPTEKAWEEQKSLLILIYGEEGLSLPSVMKIMKVAGLLNGYFASPALNSPRTSSAKSNLVYRATQKMYKTRFEKWGVKKNECHKPRRRALKKKETQLLSENDLRGIIEGVRAICESSIHEKAWALDDHFRVIEDEWDDALGDILFFIKYKLAKDTRLGLEEIRGDLAPVVEKLGFFSLPTVLTLAFYMCEELKHTDLIRNTVGQFLLECEELSEQHVANSPRHRSLTKVLHHAYSISQDDPDSLESLLDIAFSVYIGHVSVYVVSESNRYAFSESATVLSLISLYHVYVNIDPRCVDITLQKLEHLLELSDKDNGRESDVTLEILGLVIFVLQRTNRDDKLLGCCFSMLTRLETRRMHSPDLQLRDRLLEHLVDTKHVLASLNAKKGTRGSDCDAVSLMEEYKAIQETSNVPRDGFSKILDEQLEEVRSRLEKARLSQS